MLFLDRKIWNPYKRRWKFTGFQKMMTHLTFYPSHDLKQKSKMHFLWLNFSSTSFDQSIRVDQTGKLGQTIFWFISHLLSRDLNVISSIRTCIAFLWDTNCLLVSLFPALITIFFRKRSLNSCGINKCIIVKVLRGRE